VTITKHYCDACGDQIRSDRTLLQVVAGPEWLRHREFNLCPTCLPRLVAMLDGTHAAPDHYVPAELRGTTIGNMIGKMNAAAAAANHTLTAANASLAVAKQMAGEANQMVTGQRRLAGCRDPEDLNPTPEPAERN
jgi:hypothetical protein